MEPAMSPPRRRRFVGAGSVKTITDRGFGFIRTQGLKGDLFFHSKELIGVAYDELRTGDSLGFDVVEGAKGLIAINVKRNGIQHVVEIPDDDQIDEHVEVRVVIRDFTIKLAEAIARKPSALQEIEWRDLERVVAEAFAGLGLDTELTEGTKDGGKDVILSFSAFNQKKSYLVEIKHYRSGKRVQRTKVLEFVHVVAHENRSGGLMLSTSDFSKNAMEGIVEIERRKFGFGTSEKVVCLCRNYVRAKEGVWYPPAESEKIIFDDTKKV